MPDKELKPRLMRLADFTAEALEQEADGMPSSFKDRADILREMAKSFRERDHSPMIRVWEEEEGPMDLDELKEKAKARRYTKIQRDVGNAPVVNTEGLARLFISRFGCSKRNGHLLSDRKQNARRKGVGQRGPLVHSQ